MNQTTSSLNHTKWPFQPYSTILLSLLIVAVTLRILKKKIDHKSMTKLPKLPPGPLSLPFIGCTIQFLLNKPRFRWLLRVLSDNNGDITCLRIGKSHIVLVGCPKIAQEMLKQQDAIFASRPVNYAASTFSHGFLGTILTPFGEEWKKARKIFVNEIVSASRMQSLHDKRVGEADNLVKYVYNLSQKNTKEAVVDVRLATRFFTGNLTRKMMFNDGFLGTKTVDGGPGEREIEHVESCFLALSYVYAFCISDYFPLFRRN